MRVLLATDGSEAAGTATRWTCELPLDPGAEVLVATAVRLPDAITIAWTDAAQAHASAAAEEARRVVAERFTRCDARVVDGDPRQALVDLAERWSADLVVVGARGAGAHPAFFLGSVSLAVARHAPGAVLVAKGPPRPIRTALVAVDDSLDALAAARFFSSFPLPPGTRVRLLAVAEPPHFPASAPGPIRSHLRAAIADAVAERTSELVTVLAEVAGEFGERALAVERAVVAGHPAAAILEAAATADADLVVVGARGLGVFGRLLLGSVSERVLHASPCPVLVVRSGARPAQWVPPQR